MFNKKRGYYGIAFYEPKWSENIGTAVRSANCFGCDFIAVIGKRYKKQPTDTTEAFRHVPIYEYNDLQDFLNHIPIECDLVCVEVDGKSINNFIHPRSAIYLIGGEDRTLPNIKCKSRISFSTKYCLNMAMASTLVSFDRVNKIESNNKPI